MVTEVLAFVLHFTVIYIYFEVLKKQNTVIIECLLLKMGTFCYIKGHLNKKEEYKIESSEALDD